MSIQLSDLVNGKLRVAADRPWLVMNGDRVIFDISPVRTFGDRELVVLAAELVRRWNIVEEMEATT